MSKSPYISFVFTGRNDNYGGDFKQRLQNCVSRLFSQLVEFDISAEIIFVNYNPVSGSPRIQEFIRWPKSTENVIIRIITVLPAHHKKFIEQNGIKNIPVIEYLGKNVGIRRSKGEFICAMNPDILFPDKFIQKISGNLYQDRYYRANRIDFEYDNGRKKLICINLKGHTHKLKYYSGLLYLWLKIRYGVVNWYMINTIKIEPLLNRLSIPVYYDNVEFRFHCKSSGDFMMMHTRFWKEIGAYYESAPIALHIDSLFVVQAAMSGLKEYVLDIPVYHQEHERRYLADNRNEEENTAYRFFQRESQKMLKEKKSMNYNNHADWGLNTIDLPEIYC